MTMFRRLAGMLVASGGFMLPALAMAGPCSADIASLGKAMSASPALGPTTSGTIAGSNVSGSAAPMPSTAGTTAQGKLGGSAGTKEMSAAAGGVATSDQDVQRQQAGVPTQAQSPSATMPASTTRTAQAKMELEHARMLDAKDDSSCSTSVDKARQLMGNG